MIPTQPITFLNTGLPVMVMALAAWWVPLYLSRRAHSQQALMRAILTSALSVLIMGAVIFAGIYQAGGIPVLAALLDQPTVVGGYFARLSLIAGIIWAPVLALAWYVLAQGVERRKGEAIAREGRR